MMAGISDETLMAYVDGELDELARTRLERAMADDPRLGAAAETQRRLKSRLAEHYDPVMREEVPERLRALLESNVRDIQRAGPRRWAKLGWPRLAGIAATFVAGMLVAQILFDGANPERSEGGPIVAGASLAEALESSLASSQSADAKTRIGVSFAARDGRFCRTFTTPDLAGLACRDGEAWELVTAVRVSGGAEREYRQAGSGAALVMQVAQELIKGEPFDAEAERRARDGGWRIDPRPGPAAAKDPKGDNQ